MTFHIGQRVICIEGCLGWNLATSGIYTITGIEYPYVGVAEAMQGPSPMWLVRHPLPPDPRAKDRYIFIHQDVGQGTGITN